MAYKVLDTELGHKVFDWVVGEPKICYMKTAPYVATDDLICELVSRLTGGVTTIDAVQEGSVAYYVSFTLPASLGETEGFLFRVKKRSENSDDWYTIATGAIHPRGPSMIGASGVL